MLSIVSVNPKLVLVWGVMNLAHQRASPQQAAAGVRSHNGLPFTYFQPRVGSCLVTASAAISRPRHVVRVHACSADFPQSLRHWESLRTAALSAGCSAPGAHPQALAEQWLQHQHSAGRLAATAVAAPEQTRTQVSLSHVYQGSWQTCKCGYVCTWHRAQVDIHHC